MKAHGAPESVTGQLPQKQPTEDLIHCGRHSCVFVRAEVLNVAVVPSGVVPSRVGNLPAPHEKKTTAPTISQTQHTAAT